MLKKPFYRIYRPNIGASSICAKEQYGYCTHADFAPERSDLVIAYQLIIKDLHGIFEFIEPSDSNLCCYSHRIYELLLRTCTEVENNFKGILEAHDYKKKNDLTMCDYKKTNNDLKLNEYTLMLKGRNTIKKMSPFEDFSKKESPQWYKDYNGVKHGRFKNFKNANLKNLINAIAGLYVLLYAQFGICANYVSEPSLLVFPNKLEDANEYRNLFIITDRPKFDESDKYSFTWNTLQNDPSPFTKINF